jgi:hypothetical protein
MLFSPQAGLKPSAQGRTALRLRGLTPPSGEKRARNALDGSFRPLTMTRHVMALPLRPGLEHVGPSTQDRT